MNTPQLHRLIDVIRALLHPETGCPWDLKQTHKTLLPYLLEESYEFMNAVEQNDDNAMKDEIGDVLLQVLLHAEIASKENRFDLESVAKNLADKMIRRHPHVFENGGYQASDEEIKDKWKEIKEKEKGERIKINYDDLSYPSLLSSYKIGKKTTSLNFDWDNVNQVVYKVEEEWQELKEELTPQIYNRERAAEELGDFLFSAAQLARHMKLNPEELLRAANRKFIKRFMAMEQMVKDDGKDITQMSQEELDVYWAHVKKSEHGS